MCLEKFMVEMLYGKYNNEIMKDKIEKAQKRLELVNQWITNCDTKSSFILTFYGVMLTIIFTSDMGKEMMNVFSFEVADKWNWESVKNFLLFILVIAFLGSIGKSFYHIYNTLRARINSDVYEQTGLITSSNLFFGTIAQKNFQDFEQATNKESEEDYLKDLNSQIFINSKIADEKFKHYNKSICWTFISLGGFLLVNIISNIFFYICGIMLS